LTILIVKFAANCQCSLILPINLVIDVWHSQIRKNDYETSKKSEHVLPQVQETHQARCREGKEEEG